MYAPHTSPAAVVNAAYALPLIVIDSDGSRTPCCGDASTGGEKTPAVAGRSAAYSCPSLTHVTSTRPPLATPIRGCDEAFAWPTSTRTGGPGTPSVSVDANTCAAPASVFRYVTAPVPSRASSTSPADRTSALGPSTVCAGMNPAEAAAGNSADSARPI